MTLPHGGPLDLDYIWTHNHSTLIDKKKIVIQVTIFFLLTITIILGGYSHMRFKKSIEERYIVKT